MAHTFVILGASGDLTHRKLVPALYHLFRKGRLPKDTRIVGFSRTPFTHDAWRGDLAKAVARYVGNDFDPGLWDRFSQNIYYHPGDIGRAEDFATLARLLREIEKSEPSTRVYYLATAPQFYEPAIEQLGRSDLASEAGGKRRVIIEKPFGTDLESARRLNAGVHAVFSERQVYRIDHYLGKETVQNLLAFRFGNTLFESAWNRDHIQAMQISVAEALGVEHRAGYYEQAGALRDMVQNHLTQLLTLTAMEVPAALEADSIRFEKIKVLRSVAPIRHDAIVFAQYTAAEAKGKKLPGYRQEPGVAPRSKTETFVALKTEIENWRWQGVPFYLRTGKRLARRVTEITINFRTPPVALFTSFGCVARGNTLVITLEPDEGFELSFEVKSPGEQFALKTQRMKFRYSEVFGALSGGYETLLLDIMRGDQTLFVHGDEAEAAWRLYAPLLRNLPPLYFYPAGSWGPAEAANFGTYPPTSPEWSPALNRRA
jgi:glucose-6-phosphate 1-dehydrogenase